MVLSIIEWVRDSFGDNFSIVFPPSKLTGKVIAVNTAYPQRQVRPCLAPCMLFTQGPSLAEQIDYESCM